MSDICGDASQKSEDNFAMAETELDKQTSLTTELTRKVDELQAKADQAARLKDQLDEYVYLPEVPNSLHTRPTRQVSPCCRQTPEDGKCDGKVQEEASRKCRPSSACQGPSTIILYINLSAQLFS